MKCTTIDEVITTLTTIIEDCKVQQNPLGYFAILYRKVTIRVKKGIQNNEFEDNLRMEKLDVVFANRYLEAYEAYKQHQACSKSWQTTFDTAPKKGIMILQHILLGINAHINYDLGIATLDTVEPLPLVAIKKDFTAINHILAEMVDDVKMNISHVSPIFKWLMPLAKNIDELLINFSIQLARDGAWDFATTLSLNNKDIADLNQRDETIAMLARKLIKPFSTRLSWIIRTIAFAEWRSVANNMILMEKR